MNYYILNGHQPELADDFAVWERKCEDTEGWRVANSWAGDVKISTIFLGIDYNFFDEPPLLFETKIFGGEHDGYHERCSTWEQAVEQHERAVELVKRK